MIGALQFLMHFPLLKHNRNIAHRMSLFIGFKPDKRATKRHLLLSSYPWVVLKDRLLMIVYSCGPQMHIVAPESSAKDGVKTFNSVYQVANEQLTVGRSLKE